MVSEVPISGELSFRALDSSAHHEHFTRLRRRQVIMNPDTQIILDEIARRFTDNDAKWDRRLAAQDKAISTLVAAQEGFVAAQEGRINALEKTTGLFEDWRQNLGESSMTCDWKSEGFPSTGSARWWTSRHPCQASSRLPHQLSSVLRLDRQLLRPVGTASNQGTGRWDLGR